MSDYLRGQILAGQLPPGEFIRIDRVADELSVSATPAREALLALRGDGLVEQIPNRGFRVVALRREDIEDVYYVQMEIAGELAARAASKVSSSQFADICAIQADLVGARQDGNAENLEALNHQFHRLINRAAVAPRLWWFLLAALRYVPTTNYGMIEGWPEASIQDHEAIIRALESGNADRARRAMQFHIQHASDLLIAYLDSQGFWSERPSTGRFS